MRLPTLLPTAAWLGLCLAAHAQIVETYSFDTFSSQPSISIPDGNAAGLSDVRSINSTITTLTTVSIHLDISGEFNGDLYAYLRHESGISILLNRPGRTLSSAAGYADGGFDITLQTSAANGDIHTYRNLTTPAANSPLTGTWQPDARAVDPANALDTTARTASLDVFNGMNANGQWTLFVADLQSGGTHTLNRWDLELTGVPEPTHTTLAIGAVLLIGCAVSKLRRSRTANAADDSSAHEL